MKKGIKVIDDSQILVEAKKDFSQYIDIDILNKYTKNTYSQSTLLALRSDWNRYVDHCYSQGSAIFPPQSDTIRLFLENESKNRKFSTIRRYSITLSDIYRLLAQNDPLRDTHIRQLLLELRLDKHGDQKQTDAFTSIHLKQINKKLTKSNKLSDIRDLAIYNIMFECALKRSELRDMTICQVSEKDSTTFISLNDFSYSLSNQAANSLNKWMAHLNFDCDSLFRAIDKHNNISNSKLNDSSIFRIFRKVSELIGIPGLKFSGQSARIGAAQELHKQGEKITGIQQFGRWQSPVMPSQYVGNLSQSETLQLRYKKFKPWN